MDVSLQHEGRCLIVSPEGPLVAGGPAEEFEHVTQGLFRHGYRHLVADLHRVPMADSAGIRALVRTHASAQRRGLVFRVAQPNAQVRQLISMAQLDTVLDIHASVDTARARRVPWNAIGFSAGAVALSAALVWSGLHWDTVLSGVASPADALRDPAAGSPTSSLVRPFLVVVKLVAAALIGFMVTAVHHPAGSGRASRAMEQAQILLCVSGAMMMIIIGDSLARAFGIAGAASIIRFRTPVDDPKDVTVLFLLMGLGMAVGLGAFAAAGMATLFLCVFLVLLARLAETRVRPMMLEVVSESRAFPMKYVEDVLGRHGVSIEPREVEHGEKEAVIEYHALVPHDTSLEILSEELMADSTRGIKSVSWEAPKKSLS